ncbi:MAG: DUF362 domain-containing protein [Polyangiales bacterium]
MRRLLLAAVLVGCPSQKNEPPSPKPPASASTVASTSTSTSASASASTDVVTQASPAYDAGPPVVVSGSVDGAALRARNHARLESDRSPVTVLRGDDARTLGKRICEATVPKRPAETKVLLKPNLGGFDWFKDPAKNAGDDGVRGRITDPEFVRGVIQCLKERGHTKITVAEGWGATHKDWEKLVAVSGYAAMTKEEGVPLVAMDDDGVFDVAPGEPGKPMAITGMEKTRVPTLLVPKILAEHLQDGLFISLPKIKAHRFGVVSLGIKGMQGTIMYSDASPAFRQKWRTHRELNKWLDGRKKGEDDRALYVSALETFAERIADVLEVEAPHVVLAEGAPAMGGDGFQKLFPSEAKVAIGGTNVVLVDRVGAAFLGLFGNEALGKELAGHTTSPLIESAAKRFGIDLAPMPKLDGDGASLLSTPRPTHFVGMAPFQIHSGAAEPPKPVPSAVVHAAALGGTKITIDGRGDDPAWAHATPVSWTTDFSGADTGIETRARFVWSKGVLYALFEVFGTALNTDTSKKIDVEREKLWQEDCVELFLDPTPASPRSYYEIEVGPYGHFLDLAIDEKKSDVGWSGGLEIGTTRDAAKKTAVIEMAITNADLVGSFAAEKRLRLGLFRMEGRAVGAEARKYLAWSPPHTQKPNFHVPDAFGALVLDPP